MGGRGASSGMGGKGIVASMSNPKFVDFAKTVGFTYDHDKYDSSIAYRNQIDEVRKAGLKKYGKQIKANEKAFSKLDFKQARKLDEYYMNKAKGALKKAPKNSGLTEFGLRGAFLATSNPSDWGEILGNGR